MKQDFRNTKIRLESEEHSKAFQEAVFSAGGRWLHSGEFYQRGVDFIFVKDSLSMTLCDNAVFFQEHDYKEIHFPLPTKGYIHAELMTKFAEDAQTHTEPWELWQFKAEGGVWCDCPRNPHWRVTTEYRRKPKTHIVDGVEIPDLRVTPELGSKYYLADPTSPELAELHTYVMRREELWFERGLSYQYSEEGKQAAVLHSKAMLGIAYLSLS